MTSPRTGDGGQHSEPKKEALVGFRTGLRRGLSRWGDALFELADALLCATGPLRSVPGLSLEPEFRRSHGSLYKALARGRVEVDRLRKLLVEHRPAGWPLVFAVDASTWDRCDAECSPERASITRHPSTCQGPRRGRQRSRRGVGI
jgi:hypothetical protein